MTAVRPSQVSDGATAVAAVGAGQTSVADTAEQALARVARLDESIGAFRIVDEELVRTQARQLDTSGAGALRGLVVGVKDVIDTADLPTGYGSPLFSDHQPSRDADVVTTLKSAGALMLGKTESTEFAMFQPTRTRNPLDLTRTPGGSSSGSAAAVAAGMVHAALGTQTAGSVLRPAAYCGVFGFKPAHGWTSTAGVFQLAEHLDTVGLFARSVRDLELLHRTLRHSTSEKRPPPDTAGGATGAVGDGRRLCVGVLRADEWALCESDVYDALDAVAGRLQHGGVTVVELAMPPTWASLPTAHRTVMAVEVARNLRDRLGDRVRQISPSAQAIVAEGDACPLHVYEMAGVEREEAVAALPELASSLDLVVLPSALGPAPVGLDFTGDPVMCRPATLLGIPAANVPAHWRSDGLPIGLQAMAPHFNDLLFLRHLALLEAVLDPKECP
jgi:Asp-tRNA(Asn)/Glu-tRNA(Gln) amidotransferase A subunit family amidase